MPKVSADVRYPVIDIPRAKKKIGKIMTDFVFEVLADWVTTTTTVIPVWSGASRASFLKLANQAKVKVEIEPLIVAPIGSRIPWGYQTSVGVVIADARGSRGLYGWDWESALPYIDDVESRVRFLEAGQRAVDRHKPPKLPEPPIKKEKTKK